MIVYNIIEFGAVGYGSIRHARISNIVIEQCLNIAQFCTAYNNYGRVYIEDVNFSNISAENTDRVTEAFADNDSMIKNVTMENIRSTSTTVNYIGIGANTKITDCDGFIQRNCRL